jgi:undecaprenyl diphosphate synthase
MDGNGRWAESRGLPRIEGHKAGVESVKKMIRCCLEEGIPCLSLFAFSSENWSRPAEEVDFLMELFLQALRKELTELNSHGVRIRFTGDRTRLSLSLQQQMMESEEATQNNQKLILNLVVNYGGKWDLVQATQKIARAVQCGDLTIEDITERCVSQFLDTQDLAEPDLFIRTSGELRISNFFLWQLAYTELYFTEIHWPDFSEVEMKQAIAAFATRKRRFGQVL